jgi:hypothetical protein
MAKVKIPFYCTKEKKSYKAGKEYKGKRTDLKHLMEGFKEEKKED